MKYFKYSCIAFLLGLTSQFASAQTDFYENTGIPPEDFSRVGKSGWQFLHLPTHARYAALANIKTAVTDNHSGSVFYNPAKLVDINGWDAELTQIDYIADITYSTGAVACQIPSVGVFGIHFAYLNSGDMLRTMNLYNEESAITSRLEGSSLPDGLSATFDAADLLIGLSYARQITDRLAIGTNFSYIEERLDDVKASNLNIDFGVHFQTGFRSLRFALLGRNFGPDVRFGGYDALYGNPIEYKMPLEFLMGIGYDFIGEKTDAPQKLSGYIELYHPNDDTEKVHLAAEYILKNVLSIRSGYRFNYDEQGLTLGTGFKLHLGEGLGLAIDYAFLDYGRLQETHLMTLGFCRLQQ